MAIQVMAVKLGQRGYREVHQSQDSNEAVTYRFATDTDIPMINRVRLAAFPHHIPSYALNHIPEDEQGEVHDLSRQHLLAFMGGSEASGVIAVAELESGVGFVGSAFVARDCTGKSVASGLVARAEEELVKRGCRSVIMQIHRESSWGSHIQTRFQFRPAPGDSHLLAGGLYPGFLIYRKDLIASR